MPKITYTRYINLTLAGYSTVKQKTSDGEVRLLTNYFKQGAVDYLLNNTQTKVTDNETILGESERKPAGI